VDPSKKVPDLNCEVQDLLLEVVGHTQEVLDLRSGKISPPQFNPWWEQRGTVAPGAASEGAQNSLTNNIP